MPINDHTLCVFKDSLFYAIDLTSSTATDLLVEGLDADDKLIPIRTPVMLTGWTPQTGWVFTTYDTATGFLLEFNFGRTSSLEDGSAV